LIEDLHVIDSCPSGTKLSDEIWRSGETDPRERATQERAIAGAERPDDALTLRGDFPQDRIEVTVHCVPVERNARDESEDGWSVEIAIFKVPLLDDKVRGRCDVEEVGEPKDFTLVRLAGHGRLLIEMDRAC
jgi:hypothetical protein